MRQTDDKELPANMAQSIPHPTRVGVLLNPQSGYVRRHLAALRQLAQRLPNALVIEASSPDQITQAVKTFTLAAQDLMVVIGGDGTLQAALTAILNAQSLAIPRIVIVPAGTTNMSAADLGTRLKPAAALRALHDWLAGTASAPAQRQRAVLRISDASQMPPQCGLFFGAGAIVSGVRYFHSSVRPKGVRGALGPSLAFVRMLLSVFARRGHPLLPATQARLHLQQHCVHAKWLVVLATTLDTLLMGSKPYWGTENAPVHFTAVAHRPPRFLAALFFLLRGKTNATIKTNPAYVSHNLTQTMIDDLTEYLLDGEIFYCQGQLHLSATADVRFIVF